MATEISVSAWTFAYYGECVRHYSGVDAGLCMNMAIACYQADPSRDPIEAAQNDRGAAFYAMEPGWVRSFVTYLRPLLERERPGAASPDQLMALGKRVWTRYFGMVPEDAAEMVLASWGHFNER